MVKKFLNKMVFEGCVTPAPRVLRPDIKTRKKKGVPFGEGYKETSGGPAGAFPPPGSLSDRRGSCWGRGEISGGGGSFKKKKKSNTEGGYD